MNFRFRRSIRLLPDFRLNLSKSGTSMSVGGRGATMNYGPRGKRMRVGLPGTGLSYSRRFARGGGNRRGGSLFGLIVIVGVIYVIVKLLHHL